MVDKKCKHYNVINKRAKVKLYLFDLIMIYEVCLNCGNIKRTQKRWSILTK